MSLIFYNRKQNDHLFSILMQSLCPFSLALFVYISYVVNITNVLHGVNLYNQHLQHSKTTRNSKKLENNMEAEMKLISNGENDKLNLNNDEFDKKKKLRKGKGKAKAFRRGT